MMLTQSEANVIERWTSRKLGPIIFDSNVDDWNRYTSSFLSKIHGRSHIICVIVDTSNNKFGFYVNACINKVDLPIYDPNAFCFSLNSNGRLNGIWRLTIRDPSKAFGVMSANSEWLFSVGDGGRGCNDDINMMKRNCQNCSPGNGCKQSSYNYDNFRNALCGSQRFTPRRFVVIQMN